MSFYNTGNPVPSIDPRDLDDNAKHIDEIANSTELTYIDRLGTQRLTMAGVNAQASAAVTLRSDLAALTGAGLVGFERTHLSQRIQNIQQALSTQAFSPWEKAHLVVTKTDPLDPKTWDWRPAIQALIDEVWTYNQAGLVFNGGKSASMGTINLGGQTYGLAGRLVMPSGGGIGGAGGSFRITGGGLVAISAFPANQGMYKPSSSNTNDWVQCLYIDNVEFDGAKFADYCIEVEKSAGIYIRNCRITRYKKRGVTTTNSAFNVIVSQCYVEANPYLYGDDGPARRALAPEAGIYFGSPDCMASGNVVIGNIWGIRTTARTRVHDNHCYGNKYSVQVTSQYVVGSGNYFENPLIATNCYSDNSWVNNFFSNDVRGGCFLSPDDGLGQFRGASISAQPRSVQAPAAAGTITLSATSGAITVTSTADDFSNFIATGNAPDGARITAGTGYAIVVDDPANTTKQVAARVVDPFSGTSFAPGAWTHATTFLALSETTFGATSAYTLSSSASIQYTGTAVNGDNTVRSFYNNGGTLGILSRNQYDWTVGDTRGDFFIGSGAVGLSLGVVNSGANSGSAAIWAAGTLERINFGTKAGGLTAFISASGFHSGVDGGKTLGGTNTRWSATYSVELRPGTGATIWTSGTGSPEGVKTAPIGSLFTRTDGGPGLSAWLKPTGAGNTGWVAVAERASGTTAQRPTLAASVVGYFYFDTTLGKPIWWKGAVWVDATGATV
jgi:hypothetical protein